MFWKKETEEEKNKKELEKFNNNLEELKKQKVWLDGMFNYYDLFNSLLLFDGNIWCICSFNLPNINDEVKNKIHIIAKNKFWKEKKTSVLYRSFYLEFEREDFLNQIIKQKENFINMRKQLNIFGFDITKIEENITEL